MTIAVGRREPALDGADRLGSRQRPGEDARVRADTDEREYDRPREGDRLDAPERTGQPDARDLVLARVAIDRVQEHVRVGDEHAITCPAASLRAISWSSSSPARRSAFVTSTSGSPMLYVGKSTVDCAAASERVPRGSRRSPPP